MAIWQRLNPFCSSEAARQSGPQPSTQRTKTEWRMIHPAHSILVSDVHLMHAMPLQLVAVVVPRSIEWPNEQNIQEAQGGTTYGLGEDHRYP
eukprot:CAMPEP_0119363408 /NCGR_PEP_ID=MMETSP1334-20130426/10329_1 /TAXON_ID=127549 /ORGANISM="Calcidiscus leptoporus, Strain RCC1130" /LENGTH=91 /DNA_ID=CAMNT_0007378855 /DNA_START=112 /DNA_END=387 /DNA_ORIENTATION=+